MSFELPQPPVWLPDETLRLCVGGALFWDPLWSSLSPPAPLLEIGLESLDDPLRMGYPARDDWGLSHTALRGLGGVICAWVTIRRAPARLVGHVSPEDTGWDSFTPRPAAGEPVIRLSKALKTLEELAEAWPRGEDGQLIPPGQFTTTHPDLVRRLGPILRTIGDTLTSVLASAHSPGTSGTSGELAEGEESEDLDQLVAKVQTLMRAMLPEQAAQATVAPERVPGIFRNALASIPTNHATWALLEAIHHGPTGKDWTDHDGERVPTHKTTISAGVTDEVFRQTEEAGVYEEYRPAKEATVHEKRKLILAALVDNAKPVLAGYLTSGPLCGIGLEQLLDYCLRHLQAYLRSRDERVFLEPIIQQYGEPIWGYTVGDKEQKRIVSWAHRDRRGHPVADFLVVEGRQAVGVYREAFHSPDPGRLELLSENARRVFQQNQVVTSWVTVTDWLMKHPDNTATLRPINWEGDYMLPPAWSSGLQEVALGSPGALVATVYGMHHLTAGFGKSRGSLFELPYGEPRWCRLGLFPSGGRTGVEG